MKALKPKKLLAGLLGAVVLFGLLTTFAIELANTQAKNQADVRARVHERAVLAAALIDGLFNSVSQSRATYTRLYGGPRVSRALLNARKQTDTYLAITDAQGNVLASSNGLPPAAAAELPHDVGLRFVQRGAPYGIGNQLAAGGAGVLNFVVGFPAADGSTRVLVSGFAPQALDVLLQSDLRKIPGVRGAASYVIDGNGVVLASTNRRVQVGSRFGGPYPRGNANNFSRDTSNHYYDEVRLAGSQWRIVLESPDGPLYAPVTGLEKWLPWVIFAAFALVGLVAFGLVGRVVSAVAETREANARLETLNRELETTNRMLAQRADELARSNEELDQFASIASHDMQEPLRKVRTFTQELTRIEATNLSDKGRDYLERANAAAERMQTLIEDLLKFSRVSTHASDFTAVDLGAVVEEILTDLSEPIERTGAHVHVGELPTITGEPLQMRQLMQNLVSNALKFHAPGVSPEVWVDSVCDRDEAQITVRDNGIGFDPRYAGRIFRVFERLHGRTEYPGTGIGLALCRKIVERHGGSIRADATPGQGATFTVTLPLHPAPGPVLAGAGSDRTPAHV